MMKKHISIIIAFNFIGLASCVKQSPQLPANKYNELDSTTLTLQLANEKLIALEDSTLTVLISDSGYTKADNGYWYKVEETKTTSTSDKCELSYKIFSLEGNLLLEEEKTVVIGKKELLPALDEFILEHSKAEKFWLVVPWYLAYGISGKSPEINAYQSIKVYVTVYDK